MLRGNCYASSEALYHLFGGKEAGWKPTVLRHEGSTHWYLTHRSGLVVDPTAAQFRKPPDYSKGRGCGFLTKKPSRRARRIMDILLWQRPLIEAA
jgi:hypothetical protein